MPKHPEDKPDDPQSRSNEAEIPLHPLVKKVVPDPDKPPETVVLVGYLGASGKGKDNLCRLYLDLDFCTYYELQRSDVLHAEKADPSQEEKPTKVFVKASAKLSLVKTIAASFLQGTIASSFPHVAPVAPTAYGGGICAGYPMTSHVCPSGQPHTHGCSLHQPYTFQACSHPLPGGGMPHTPSFGHPGGAPTESLFGWVTPAYTRLNTDAAPDGGGSVPGGFRPSQGSTTAPRYPPMLNVDNVARFLLENGLIELSAILDSELTIRSFTRRNRNLTIERSGGNGFFLKQAEEAGTGAGSTLSREAAFHRFCADEPAVRELSQLIPRLLAGGGGEAVLIFELISDAVSLRSQLETAGGHMLFVDPMRKLGQALATVHRSLCLTEWGMDPRLSWLSRCVPWSMTLHRPATSMLASLGPATYQTLRVVQAQEAFTEQLERLYEQWQTRCVIHGDVRFDNILVRSPRTGEEPEAVELWVTDWEMVQFGDPAWDLAGALQDLLVFWVSTMPLSEDLTPEQMIAQARVGLAGLRTATRAMWFAYRKALGLQAGEADDLLVRAVAFSAARMVQSAFEAAHGANSLPRQTVVLLQISANLLLEPERGQAELYGIPGGSHGL